MPNITKKEAKKMVDEFSTSTSGFQGWVTDRYICMSVDREFARKMSRHPLDYMLVIEAMEERLNSYYVEKQITSGHDPAFYLFFRRHIYLETN